MCIRDREETHLEKNDTAVKICGTTEGRLPGSCAPLAFPYVPVQCDNPARYSQQDALQAGTLFPGLNLPFHADMENRQMCISDRLCGQGRHERGHRPAARTAAHGILFG